MVVFAGLVVVIQLVFLFALWRELGKLKRIPKRVHGSALPRVSVVIPAFDEERNIEACVRSVAAQFDGGSISGSIVIVDDRSVDSTPEIARRLQLEFPELVRVLRTEERPQTPKFHGKNWACWSAMRTVEDPYVVFLDADVRLKGGALERTLGQAVAEQTDLLSIVPAIVCGCLSERLVQPVLITVMGALFRAAEVNDPNSEHAFAVGPFLLFRRDFYNRIGGHFAVAGEVVEDVALAKATKANRGILRLYSGTDLASLRMYHSFSQLWEGWTKNIFLGLEKSLVRAGLTIFAILMLFVFPFFLLLVAFAGALDAGVRGDVPTSTSATLYFAYGSVALVYAFRMIVWLRLKMSPLLIWATPVGGILVALLVIDSARRVLTKRHWTWKGRSLAN